MTLSCGELSLSSLSVGISMHHKPQIISTVDKAHQQSTYINDHDGGESSVSEVDVSEVDSEEVVLTMVLNEVYSKRPWVTLIVDGEPSSLEPSSLESSPSSRNERRRGMMQDTH